MAQNDSLPAARRFAEIGSGVVERAAAILDEEIAAAALPGRGTATRSGSAGPEAARVLKAPRPARAGETVEILTRLQIDNDAESDELLLAWTELVADGDRRIPAAHVSATPARVRIPANGTEDIAARVEVPAGTLSGLYRGLLHVPWIDDVWVIVTVRIE